MIEKQVNDLLTLKKITINEIPDFINSELYKSLNVKPISEPRAKSYFNNPRALAMDPVIYLLFSKDQFLGFRTILPDLVKTKNDEIRFGWCSGNWINPDHRRKGYSKLILDEAYKDWQYKLMYTNFAKESHLLYNKTSYFRILQKRTRTRFYGDVDVKEILKNRKHYNWIKPVLPGINLFFKLAFLLKKSVFVPYKLKDFSINIKHHPTPDFFSEPIVPKGLFARSQQEFKWASDYPWLSDANEYKSINYPFSLYEPDHKIWYLTIYKHNQVTGKLILSTRNKQMKLLYNYAPNNAQIAAKAIINLCHEKNMKTFSVMDPQISKQIVKLKKPFIASKRYQMGIYSTFEINDSKDISIHDGDGDYIFT